MKKAKTRIMICQPMSGKTEAEIMAIRDAAVMKIAEEYGEGRFVIADTYKPENYEKHDGLWCIGKALQEMSRCDAVYFCEGWNRYRGCLVEYVAAGAYKRKIIIEGQK